jgi:hypothetical protein
MENAKWVIGGDSLNQKWRDQLGDAEYERRRGIAAAKREAIPDSKWELSCVVGGQFESIAMQCSQEIFDKLADRDWKFWTNLVYKVTGVS